MTRTAEFLLVGSSVFIALLLLLKPDAFGPLHYDFSGNADGFGKQSALFILPLTGLVLYLLLKWAKRFKKYFNYPVTITPENKQRQEELAFRLIDVYCILSLLLFNLIGLCILLSFGNSFNSAGLFIGLLFMIIYLVPLPVYIRRARKIK
jgi:uncharacterized membrane protein YbhN (UPF0104 family)